LKADLFTAAFFAGKTEGNRDAIPTSADLARINQGIRLAPQLVDEINNLAQEHAFFHWHLEFPEVFAEEKGGFDVVLGNPPWEVSQLSEGEFFASRDPSIAAMAGAQRKKAIADLENEGMLLWDEYQKEMHACEAMNQFFRVNGRFFLTAKGKINLYSLFAELTTQLVNKSGRAGIIIPSGIATDNSTKAFFDYLLSSQRLHSLFEFENEGFFAGAGAGHMVRFALTTIGGFNDTSKKARLLFQGHKIQDLAEAERCFTLSASEINLFNPNTKTCPIFQTRYDAELTKKLYLHAGVFINEEAGEAGNPWKVNFRQGLFNMASDSGFFLTLSQLLKFGGIREGTDWLLPNGTRYIPLYEAKMLYLYNHRHGDFRDAPPGERPHRLPLVTDEKLNQSTYFVEPFYWVPLNAVEERLNDKKWKYKWLLGWRDVTDARASMRSVIAGLVPRCGCGDTFLLMFPEIENIKMVACLYADQCSIIHDYVARQKIGGLHLKYHTKKQVTTLPPTAYTQPDLDFILPRVLELTYTAFDMQPFAEDMGYNGSPFAWDPERRAQLKAELDAYYARLYGLTRDELRYILDPADIMGKDYPSETFRVLKNNDIRNFGEYRTQRLVLEAWDKLEGEYGHRRSLL
ncbi:MAG: hypothetical protein HGB26_03120, partial [Desulfobulbaceae bacterium]|nr:hypothetical protein [Desulfobulbaceae bacterium]